MVALRAAEPADVEAIAGIWHQGYRDGHRGHVPEEVFAHRRLQDFLGRVPPLLPVTTVAEDDDGSVLGFVMVEGAELYQLYVGADARGSGVAAALLTRGEQVIAATYPTAWLAVVAGNRRARRFYERQGWHETVQIDQPSYAGPGRELLIAALRYEKQVRGADATDLS